MEKCVVVLPVYGLTQQLPSLISKLMETVPKETPIVVIDDCSQDLELSNLLARIDVMQFPNMHVKRNHANIGYVANVNEIISEYADRDLIVLNSDLIISSSWYERIRKAAYADNTIATVSTWASDGSILTWNPVKQPVYGSQELVNLINTKLSKAAEVYPTIPVAVGHLIYLRRSALNLLKGFDPNFGHGYGEEVDYSIRASEIGLRNILAVDIYVFHQAHASFEKSIFASKKITNDKINSDRYPYFEKLIAEFQLKIENLRTYCNYLVLGPRIGIDGSCFSYVNSGTSKITIEILKEITKHYELNVTVFIEDTINNNSYLDLLSIDNLSIEKFSAKQVKPIDLYWRPYQIWEDAKVEWIKRNSRSFVLGIQDLIAFDNPSYHDNSDNWANYRRVLKQAANISDATTYISNYSRNRAIESNASSNKRNIVIPNGVHVEKLDFNYQNTHGKNIAIKFLLIGLDFKHKNYSYAIDLLNELSSLGVKVELVHIGKSSTTLSNLSEFYFEFTELGELSENEKMKVLAGIDFALYPSTVEGFGLVPFEMAEYNIPTFTTYQGGLREYLPKLQYLELTWNIKNDTTKILKVIGERDITEGDLSKIRDASSNLNWSLNVQKHIDLFFEILLDKALNFPAHFGDISLLDSEKDNVNKRDQQLRTFVTHILPIGTRRRKCVAYLWRFVMRVK